MDDDALGAAGSKPADPGGRGLVGDHGAGEVDDDPVPTGIPDQLVDGLDEGGAPEGRERAAKATVAWVEICSEKGGGGRTEVTMGTRVSQDPWSSPAAGCEIAQNQMAEVRRDRGR